MDDLKLKRYAVSAAIPPYFSNRFSAWFSRVLKQTAADWLARKCQIPKQRARELIDETQSLSLKPECEFTTLAGTERALLAIVAAVQLRPQVLIYSTEALDPSGVRETHLFVAKRRKKSALYAIHLSTPAFHGDGKPADKICPPDCECLDLNLKSN